MSESTLSEIRNALLYFAKNLVIVCGAAFALAFVVASWVHLTKESPFFPTVVSTLGMLGIGLTIIGAAGVASSPAQMLSGGAISRTHARDMGDMRPAPNPWIGIGFSVFLSGVLTSYTAYALA